MTGRKFPSFLLFIFFHFFMTWLSVLFIIILSTPFPMIFTNLPFKCICELKFICKLTLSSWSFTMILWSVIRNKCKLTMYTCQLLIYAWLFCNIKYLSLFLSQKMRCELSYFLHFYGKIPSFFTKSVIFVYLQVS